MTGEPMKDQWVKKKKKMKIQIYLEVNQKEIEGIHLVLFLCEVEYQEIMPQPLSLFFALK